VPPPFVKTRPICEDPTIRRAVVYRIHETPFILDPVKRFHERSKFPMTCTDAKNLFEEAWVGLLVCTKIGEVDVQSSDGTLAFKIQAFDWGEVGVVLGSGVSIASHAISFGSLGGASCFPLFGRGRNIVLVHGLGNSGSHQSSEGNGTSSR
jgi:hypothetical protein